MELSQNKLKFLVSLHQKKFRDENGVFIAEGLKVVLDLIKFGSVPQTICYNPNRWNFADFGSNQPTCEFITLNDIQEKKVSMLTSPPGIFAVFERPVEGYQISTAKTIFLLDKINDPGNLGTIIRTAHWFGFKSLYLTQGSVDPFNPKVVQASMGSLAAVNIFVVDNQQFAEDLKANNYAVYAAEMNGIDFKKADVNKPMCIVMGSESNGVEDFWKNQALSTLTITSAQDNRGPESLNLSVSTAILMEYFANN